ncbi:MAG: acyltransferase family protein [Gemmatimonadales bacterium]
MTNDRRLDLDGLRGLAVLLVVGFHAGLPALRGAFVAVDVFFVLSGFFLATTLARRLATGEEIGALDLAARRAWRLLPGLAVVLLGTLATTLLYAPIDRAAVAGRVPPVAAFASNLAFAADGVDYFGAGQNPLLHTWTLGVELQLALGFPFLVMLLAAWGERLAGDATGADRRWIVMRTVLAGIAIAGLISFVASVIINDRAPMWAYFGPHTRLWSFCAGALMAFLTGGGQNAVGGSAKRIATVQLIGLGLLVVPSLLYRSTIEYPGVMALAPVGGTLCLLAVGDRAMTTGPGRLLGSRLLVALGAVSFGWYLWHLPLMTLGAVIRPEIGPAGKLAWGALALVAAALTHRALAASLTGGLVMRLSTGRPLLAAAGVSAAIAALGLAAARASAVHVESSIHRRYAAARRDYASSDCWSRSPSAARAACAMGATTSPTTVALLGDSHAFHWLGGLGLAGTELGWRIEPYVMGACPVADLRGLVTGVAERALGNCLRYREESLRRLEAAPPAAIILSNADYYVEAEPGQEMRLPEAVWIEGLRRTYARLAKLGVPIAVLRDVPWSPFDVPACLSRRAAGLPFAADCRFTPDRAFIAKARRTQDRAARGLPVRFVDMSDRICGPAGPCATERDGMILYTDDDHISATFSRSLAPVLGERLAAAFHPHSR